MGRTAGREAPNCPPHVFLVPHFSQGEFFFGEMSEWAALTRHRGDKPIRNDTTKRSILRSIHIVFGIPILGYIYSPFEELPNYAPVVRYVALPVIVLSGFWMWKSHVVRRLIAKGSA